MTDPMRPGDQAAPGSPFAGENLCRRCSGDGVTAGAASGREEQCPDCQGTGIVHTILPGSGCGCGAMGKTGGSR